MQAKSEDVRPYHVSEDEVIARAINILYGRLRTTTVIDSPDVLRKYLLLKNAQLEREQFDVVFLDSQHRVIAHEVMFTGTLTQTSVYPREVVKAALLHNAAAVVFSHNHPSGVSEPSRADEHLTQTLKAALALIDVRVLDHIITSVGGTTSFAERGLL